MDGTVSRCLLAAAFALLCACGAGAPRQDRPWIVDTYPPNGASLIGGIAEIRLVYDEPVTVLNPEDVLVYVNGFYLPVYVSQRTGEPNSVYLVPWGGYFIPADAAVSVQVNEGTVRNAAGHYADTVFRFYFEAGPEPDVPVGHAGAVTMLDPRVFTATASRSTPVGRDAVGLLATTRGSTRRVWCQLDGGAGTGEALAYFDPADPPATPMDVIDLSGAGDVTASAAALAIGPLARFLYLAYRNEATGRVRVYKIDADAAVEVAAIDLLSVPAGPATAPAGVALDVTTTELHVCCHDGATGTLAYVGVIDFVERDRDTTLAGTQGVALSAGAGPIETFGFSTAIADPASPEVTFVSQLDGTVSTAASTLAGTSVDLLRDRGGYLLLQPLASFAGSDALQLRVADDYYQATTALSVSDDVLGVSSGATDSVAMVGLSAESRFLLLLDAPGGRILTSWTWSAAGFLQDDLDALTAGVQAVDLSGIVPGATVLGRNVGAYAPLSP